MSNYLAKEFKLLWRSNSFKILTLILALLALFAIGRGIILSNHIARNFAKIEQLQIKERENIAKTYAAAGDAGSAAYFGFELIKQTPNPFNFITQGQSDLGPQATRIRSLALIPQIYESEIINPESLVKGRFDYSFLAVFLLPLFIIAVLFDLRASEAEAGREVFLIANAKSFSRILIMRAILRMGILLCAILLPLFMGALINSAPMAAIFKIAFYIVLYSSFWVIICTIFIIFGANSRLSALGQLAIWSVLLIISPIMVRNWVNFKIPANQGFALSLEHREYLHGAWERDRQAEVDRFINSYPQYSKTPKLGKTFEWKWYLAFHKNADEEMASSAKEYRMAIENRYKLTKKSASFLPPIALQLAIEETTNNGLLNHLEKQDYIAKKHKELREAYYSHLFDGASFNLTEYEAKKRILGD